jgi:hypothetical protein
VQADLFCGFDFIDDTNIKMASPEKAIVDFLYLSQAKTRLFASLPELEFPENFDFKQAKAYIELITSKRRKTVVTRLFNKLLDTQ